MHSYGFVTISDHRYFPGVVALINSIRHHHDLPVTVIDEGLDDWQRRALIAASVDVRKVTRSIPVNSERFGCCYAIFDIDAAPYETIVCIDPDAIVLAPLHDVFAEARTRGFVATAANGAGQLLAPGYRQKLAKSLPRGKLKRIGFLLRFPHYLRFVLGDKGRPMSSGIVGVQRKLMPAIRKAAESYRSYFRVLRWPDQDLLSYCMMDLGIDWKALPYEYNAARIHQTATGLHAGREQAIREQFNACVDAAFSEFGLRIRNSRRGCLAEHGTEIKVLHYAGPEKPWTDKPLRPGFRELWQRYYNGGRLTPQASSSMPAHSGVRSDRARKEALAESRH